MNQAELCMDFVSWINFVVYFWINGVINFIFGIHFVTGLILNCELMEYPFSFLNSPESLQSLAATEFALNLWRLEYSGYPTSQTDPNFTFLKSNFTSEKYLWLPPRIKNTIDHKIRETCGQLRHWINFHEKSKIFGVGKKKFPGIFQKCFPSIVSNSNGTISFKATAASIAKGNQFSNLEKYKIASFFCLEDDVRRIWPLVSKSKRVDRIVSNPINHWNHRMKSINDPVSAVVRFDQSYYSRNWPAFEYFFKMLSQDEQLSKTIIILNGYDTEARQILLPKFNRDQARSLLIECGCKIFGLLIQNEEYFCHVLDLWLIMKNDISKSPQTFLNILTRLWYSVFCSNWTYTSRSQANVFLIEIWTNASDELKEYASSQIRKFFEFFTISKDFSNYGHDMTVMLQLFGNANYEIRNQLWQTNWRNMVLLTKPSQLKEFIRLSLPDAEAIAAFNQRLVSDPLMKKLCRSFIQKGNPSSFGDYLRFFSKDAKQMQSIVKKNLRPNLDAIVSHNSSNLNNFGAFIRDIFSNEVKDMDKFKDDVISSKTGLQSLRLAFEENSLEDFTKVINFFAPSDKKLTRLKKKFQDYCREYPTKHRSAKFNHENWIKLLEWCTDDVEKFKQTLNIDDIFEKKICYNLKNLYIFIGEDFEFFDRFAKWYFDDDEAVKKFKSDKLFNYKKVPVMAKFVEENRKFPGEIAALAKWSFDDDQRNFEEFMRLTI